MKSFRFLFTALVALSALMFSALAFADAPAPVAAGGLAAISSVAGFLSSIPLSALSMGGVFVIELVAKLWPTANPQGWLVWIGSILNKGAAILSQLSSVVTQLDNVVAALIPQNIAAPPAAASSGAASQPPATS